MSINLSSRGKRIRMIFVVGGAFQGKSRFAGKLAAERGLKVADGFHLKIRELLEHGKEWKQEFQDLLVQMPDAVVVMDEVGAGVVPVEKRDREYREAVGWAGQLLAQKAEQVYRVVCGIGTRIK